MKSNLMVGDTVSQVPKGLGKWAWPMTFQTPITRDFVVRNENTRHHGFRLDLRKPKMSINFKSESMKFGSSGRKKNIEIDITFSSEQ